MLSPPEILVPDELPPALGHDWITDFRFGRIWLTINFGPKFCGLVYCIVLDIF